MKDLRRRFERFCLKNRGKGIPNLMLVIAIGNLAVYMLSRIDPSNIVYSYLCFSRSAILRGQVWRRSIKAFRHQFRENPKPKSHIDDLYLYGDQSYSDFSGF